MKIVVYLSSAGAINGINVMDALRASDLKIKIVAGDCEPLAAGLLLADKGYVMPPNDDPYFIHRLAKVCENELVDIALPIHSIDFPVFIKNKEFLKSKGIKTYAPSVATWNICSDKFKTIKFLKSIDIPCPETWNHEDALNKAHYLSYPLFMKRINGSGTKGVQVIKNRIDLEYYAKEGFIFQEFAEGEEYTVDIISDLKGEMLAASPRKRLKIYGGLSVCGVTVKDEEMSKSCKRIVESLKLPGPSNVQCKRDKKGSLKFYDVNPRFASGGLPLAVKAGLNIPEILVRLLMKLDLPEKLEAKEDIYMIRRWDTIFAKKENGSYEIFS